MNVANKMILAFTSFSLFGGCATTVKEKIMRNTLIAAGTGIAYGNSKDDYKTQHALMYGATSGLLAMIASLYYYDPDKQIEEMRKTTVQLREELDAFDSGLMRSKKSQRNKEFVGPAINAVESLPDQYRRLISPGEWSLSEIDEWERVDDTRLIHKTEMLELKPATLKSK